MLLPHLASRIYGTPLLIARSKLEIILAALGDRIGWKPAEAALRFAPRPVAATTGHALIGGGTGTNLGPKQLRSPPMRHRGDVDSAITIRG